MAKNIAVMQQRYEKHYSDFRGHYVFDGFLFKICFSGSESECIEYTEKHNTDFHSKYKIIKRRGVEVIEEL